YNDETILYVGAVDGIKNQRLVGSVGTGTNTNWLLGYHGGYEDKMYDANWIYQGPAATTSARAYSMTHASASGAINFYRNGTLVGSGTGPALSDLSLGGSLSVAESSVGSIGEVIVFSTALSDAARTQVEEYLQRKWFGAGLAGSILPS